MIKFKHTKELNLSGLALAADGFRSLAFGIYRNLLNQFDSKQLMLLESLGPSSIDSRRSLIGINPVLEIDITDQIVSIRGNREILTSVRAIYEDSCLLESGLNELQYGLSDRKSVWNFLRLLDDQFREIDGGVYAFSIFSYNTIYFIEAISGYIKGDVPDIQIICYSNYIEFSEDRVHFHEYGFIGVDTVPYSRIACHLKANELPLGTFQHFRFSIKKETQKDEYLNKAKRALRHIGVGDVYQIQIGQSIDIQSDISAIDVYSRMRSLNPSPYMYLFNYGRLKIIGASPESFIYMKNEEVIIRPIAGTLAKSSVPTKDAAIEEFHANPKEMAEHMMLVDLCRNDLCKVGMPGSLLVPHLMSIEEYSHVYHMVSTAKSSVSVGIDKYDVIQASFPAGTMTGTPKIRAIELISEIEDSPRGLYAGALGMIGLGVNFINTALCIRTAFEFDGTYTLRASAGMVADSLVENEYAETLHKMGSVFKAITDEEISCHIT